MKQIHNVIKTQNEITNIIMNISVLFIHYIMYIWYDKSRYLLISLYIFCNINTKDRT